MKTPALCPHTKGINAAMRRAGKATAVRKRATGKKLYVIRKGKIVAEAL